MKDQKYLQKIKEQEKQIQNYKEIEATVLQNRVESDVYSENDKIDFITRQQSKVDFSFSQDNF